jgi:tryptophan-rich sensory protein
MKNKSVSAWGTAAFVIGSMASAYFFSGERRGGKRVKLLDNQQRKLDENLVIPSNETFGLVWSVIYSSTAGLMIHQALPSQQNNPRYDRARPWWIASYALNLVFAYFFSRSDKASRIGGNLTTIAILPTAIGLHRALGIGRESVPQPERALRGSVSLYAGWLTAATVVGTANLLIEAGYRLRPAQAAGWAFAVLPFTAAVGIGVSRRLNDPYYLVPLVAAFTGIAAKQQDKATDVAAVSAACALLTTAVLVQQIREKHGEPVADEPETVVVGEEIPAENAVVIA